MGEFWCNQHVSPISQISNSHKYAFTAKKHTISTREGKERILTVTFFSLRTSIAEFRVFFNKKNFISEWLIPRPGHHTKPGQWSDATLDWFCDWHMGRDTAVCANQISEKIICDYFKSDCPPFEAMRVFQRTLRKKQLQARHKIETDQIDLRMKEAGKLPKDFDHWVNEVALNFSRYIYYKRETKKLIRGYCTSCANQVVFEITKEMPQKDVRHNQPGKCPLCGKNITFKAIGKTTQQVDKVVAAYMQKTKTGFMVRSFSVIKKYFKHYKSPEPLV